VVVVPVVLLVKFNELEANGVVSALTSRLVKCVRLVNEFGCRVVEAGSANELTGRLPNALAPIVTG